MIKTLKYEGSQEQEVKFQDQIFSKFQVIFCRFHDGQDTENACFFVLTNLNQSSRSVLKMLLRQCYT